MKTLSVKTASLIILLQASGCSCQAPCIGSRNMALGNACVSHPDPAEALFTNPAGIIPQRPTVAFHISVPFGMIELSTQTLCAVCRFGAFGSGAFISTFGTAVFRENRLGFGAAFSLPAVLRLGISIEYREQRIDRYGIRRAGTAGAGIIVRAGRWSWGWSIDSIVFAGLGQGILEGSRTFWGLTYRPDQFSVSLALHHQSGYPNEIKGALEWVPLQAFQVRLGCGLDPDFFSLGFGIAWHRVMLSIGFSYHMKLAGSESVSASFTI